MFRLFQCLAVFLLMTGAAAAERADNPSKRELPRCDIWVSREAPNIYALIDHEFARCWGWSYKITARPKPGETSFRARIRPLKYRLLGPYPNALIHYITEKEAYAKCDSWGCAFGGI